MKYRQILDELFGQKTKLKILRYLVNKPIEQSGRQIAKNIKIAHRNCHKVLQELHSLGILDMRRIGNADIYNLRKDHYLVKKVVKPLFNLESKMLEELILEIKKIKLKDIVSIVLFGSISKGKEKPHSDIDILLIISKEENKKDVEERIREKNAYFISRFGNSLSPYLITGQEFIERYKKGDKLLKNIVKDGQIIFGKTFGEQITK